MLYLTLHSLNIVRQAKDLPLEAGNIHIPCHAAAGGHLGGGGDCNSNEDARQKCMTYAMAKMTFRPR
jgi:hypothetical protein